MPRSFPFAVSEGSPPLTLGTLLQYKDKEREELNNNEERESSQGQVNGLVLVQS